MSKPFSILENRMSKESKRRVKVKQSKLVGIINKPKILFYDIETAPLKAWIWRTGEQRVNPGQLVAGSDQYEIITLCYEWSHNKKKGQLDWGKNKNSKKLVEEFTKICDEADIVIGKNNRRFDDKHLNTMRMIHGLPGRPDLLAKVDDLESQLRKHFYLPSFGLDYVSKMLGLNGKDGMCLQDWIDIMEGTPKVAAKSLLKMKKYCSKDVSDTKKIWNHCMAHFQPKFNHSIHNSSLCCKYCGSTKIHKNGISVQGKTIYQRYFCTAHNGNAGRISIKSKTDILT